MQYFYIYLFSLCMCCIVHAHATITNSQTIKQHEYVAPESCINNGNIETDSLSFYAKATNNGSITTDELLINGDFDSKNGTLTASTVTVTASCDTFNVYKNCTIRQLNFLDPATSIILGVAATKIVSLNKGFDYMGGIECKLDRAQKGNLIITNHDQKTNFTGPSALLEKSLNEGINTTNNVVALIAYLTRKLASVQ